MSKLKNYRLFFILGISVTILLSNVKADEVFTIARLKYGGGGDWYSNPSSLPNLMQFVSENTDITTSGEESVVSVGSEELFNFPIVYMNGHGNVDFSSREAASLRRYLTSGGFLIADDNYGMDKSFRREIKKVFPDKELVLLPKNHPVFNVLFSFPEGIPKIHEHDGKPAQAFAIFHEGRMVLFYSYESDLGDGWEEQSVHNDPEEVRQAALKMGANLIVWALSR
ncbi:MAG: DUF4159 domain-containing protein [Candidatus Latescibacteria bacterium]|nr:DUF4159 domain-containing protein [Candidatus Latescibacterota bacterium]